MESKRRVTKKYTVTKGCNVIVGGKDVRYEVGDVVAEKDLTPAQVKALTEMDAIQEIEDGDSK